MATSTDEATSSDEDSIREQQLEGVIADYIRSCESGTVPDRGKILKQHPKLAGELRDFFGQHDRMHRMAEPIRGFGDDLSQALGPGQKLSYVGNYELLEEIARGGMGVIYKARQTTLGRIVAVKMIVAGRLATDEDVQRFLVEAKAVAGLQHPNIVAIHEVGQHEGWHYFSMDYVEGRNLAKILRGNVLPAKQAAGYVRQMAEAIHYAHQHGTLHRDLKPSNVLIDSHDQIRITDFGLAMRIEGDTDLTRTGQIVGTPSYMPPEQAQSKRSLIGPGSDVYSMGAILYECLTGRAPFRADSVMKTIEQVIHVEAASPHLLNPGIPRDLETICLKCLEKEPHRRYGTAQLLADDLGCFLRDEPISARPISRLARAGRWCRRKPVVASLAALLLLALVAITATSSVAYIREVAHRHDIEDKNTQISQALQREKEATDDAQRRLYGSLVAQARANRLSRRIGQRFNSLDVLTEASRMAGEMALTDGDLLELRNEAIACLTLADMRTAKEWKGFPTGTLHVDFDGALERYARTDRAGNVSVRRVSDDAELWNLTGLGPGEAWPNLSPDGQFLVVRNSRFKLWSLAGKEPVLIGEGPGHWAAFSPDSRQVAILLSEGRVAQLALPSGKRLHELRIDAPEDLAINRELVGTYRKLALLYQENQQTQLAEQATNRAKLAIDQFVAPLPLDSLIELLKHRDEWSVAAANRLGLMGEAAVTAIPALSAALMGKPQSTSQWELPPAAGRALGRIGSASVPVLLKAATVPESYQRGIALEALLAVEQKPTAAAQAIRASLNDADPLMRRSAVLALERLFEAPSVLNDVVARLGDKDAGVRKAAAFALGANGLKANVAIPALIDRVTDTNPMVAQAAIAALGNIGGKSENVILALTAIVADRNHPQRKYAFVALGELGPAATVSLPVVVAALEDKDLAVRAVARQSLRRIAPDLAAVKFGPPCDPVRENQLDRATLQVGAGDWPQWGGSRQRNNTQHGENISTEWDTKSGKNIKWFVKLGSETYGNPVIANGKVYIGTNNGNGYLKRYPNSVDLGVLLCVDEATGRFLWQYSSPKLPTGRVHDWPHQGMPSTPVVDGQRLWATSNRGEVVCLDTEGFLDEENDGVFQDEINQNLDEADILWKFDMLKELGVSPHNMSHCSILMVDNMLFVCTSNGVDDSHLKIPAPDAPSFIALDRDTGKIVWTDNSPGENILHAQWASPSYGVFGDQPQVLFPGGDGWLYSFDPKGDGAGHSKVLWKFDCNPKESVYSLYGRATRNSLIAFACIYDGLIYLASGDDPEHGEGLGRLWCIDPSNQRDGSDVSADLVVDRDGQIVPHRRLCAVDPAQGERVIPNPNSAVVWNFSQFDRNADGAIEFEETFHRTVGTAVIKDDVLYISDFSGLFHCLNAKTGDLYWSYDMFAATWGSALIADGKVYIGDEDGDVAIFHHSGDPEAASRNGMPFAEINMGTSIYSTPVVANNVLYIADRNWLYAIESQP